MLFLACARVLLKPKHEVNSWLYRTDFGPSPNPLDMTLALDLGTIIMAFYFSLRILSPLLPPPSCSHTLQKQGCLLLHVAFPLMPVSGPAQQVPRPGPHSLGCSCYHLLTYPPPLHCFLDRLIALPLFTCLGFKAK